MPPRTVCRSENPVVSSKRKTTRLPGLTEPPCDACQSLACRECDSSARRGTRRRPDQCDTAGRCPLPPICREIRLRPRLPGNPITYSRLAILPGARRPETPVGSNCKQPASQELTDATQNSSSCLTRTASQKRASTKGRCPFLLLLPSWSARGP